MKNTVSKTEWVAMFREIGLDDGKMEQWHRLFEIRHPKAHADFLKWLGLSCGEIERVRKSCH
jgi:hypothetical protein